MALRRLFAGLACHVVSPRGLSVSETDSGVRVMRQVGGQPSLLPKSWPLECLKLSIILDLLMSEVFLSRSE